MPGYRKTKNVDLKKIQGQAAEELAQQKQYAKTRVKEQTEQYRATGQHTMGKKGRATMERISKQGDAPARKPGMGDAAKDLLGGVRDLLKFGKKTKKGFDDLQGLGR